VSNSLGRFTALLGYLASECVNSESTQQNGTDKHEHGADCQHIEPYGHVIVSLVVCSKD
jgi:hypothetical protein